MSLVWETYGQYLAGSKTPAQQNKNPRRPFEIAQSDFQNGNDLLWKKHMGDQEKPQNWEMRRYSWYFNSNARRRAKKPKRRW